MGPVSAYRAAGPDPAPRAWDYLFGARPDGWIWLRLKTGTWLAGAYAVKEDGWRSYAAGYPAPQDLFLVEAVEVDPDTGEFFSMIREIPACAGRVS